MRAKSVMVAAAVVIGASGVAAWGQPGGTNDGGPITYPKTKKVDHVDTYHGEKVADPYRWLEQDADVEEVRGWINEQNALTFAFLESIPSREKIKERMTELWNFERWGVPFKEGGKYFVTRNDGLQPQSVWYVMDSLGSEPRVLIDPNTMSADGTVALSGFSVSDDGARLAYGVSEAGSDWVTWRVREVATGKDTGDEVRWSKFSGASWLKDGSGFFYSRFDEPKAGEEMIGSNFYQKLYFHRLGTPQSADTLIYERKDQKEWGFYGGVTEDGKYLVINVSQGTDTRNRVFYAPITPGLDGRVVELLNEFDASYNFVGNEGSVFWFQTDLKSPRGRVIAIDVTKPERANWKELIPESKETLQGVSVVGDMFFASYLRDAQTVVRVHDLTGKHVRDVQLPGIGSAGGFGGKRTDTETFYSFTGFTTPASVYRYDVKSGKSELFKQPTVDFRPSDYETKQVFYTSKDGTKVPMFIVHKKGVKLDGSNPTLLYGYGGFNISLTPAFSVSNLVWMEMGGVYALANLRGGGEYGEEWHQAGMKLKKQNVFDDFIAAAEWLIANKYTSPKKLAIHGGSNGGLLVGACMTQRPELFGAAIPAVGVMDMLRFEQFTIGHAWASDYGSASNAEEFAALRKYSPLQNLKAGTSYPATLVTTGDHDDRVVPAHSFKFAAALQAAQSGSNPTLIRIETRAGHGAGKPTQMVIEERADMWAFLVKTLDFTPTIPSN